MSRYREEFAAEFGEAATAAIEAAGNSHRRMLLDGAKHGDDPFVDALHVAIGFECFSKDEYRRSHEIPAVDVDVVKAWCRSHKIGELHIGPTDWLAMAGGAFDEYVGVER